MSLVFKTIQTEGIAELSYLLGDDDEGIAAIFDPRPDVEVYIDMAREAKLAITHIFETHIHADLVSGSRELCARVESAKIFVSHEGGAKYGFEHEKIKDGDHFTFGEVIVTARHTPGHTPEHLSYVLADAEHPDSPWGVLTGDSLFVSSAGRPDLLGAGGASRNGNRVVTWEPQQTLAISARCLDPLRASAAFCARFSRGGGAVAGLFT